MIIFDYDQTLVDTSSVEHLRAARNWKAVMAQASKLPVYDGISDLLQELHKAGNTMAIVTKSPDMVPKTFIKAHGWPIDIVIGYHHVKNRKPHPEGLLLAMSKAGARPEETYHVGDQPQDTEASRGAKVVALGSAWGRIDASELKDSKPDAMFSSVDELRRYFKAELALK
ncbi:HAD-IA family hydrolase [Mesorhizobium sp.]|uniref:HAD family hydrolase n=1 Tax=Mesorhizobium sp. TaxID=1871066 RepID=UPI000FE857F7|nr:HAD-IA family hydrolase [Mesorhizobium sp.]RWK11037.1 MAG: HAD family hydrolase [Mesorhizobium sp.]TIQ49634.1 MAG: HAD family hydrolase [Mesorhizobium sp.]TIQ59363.1 MAG: HAD family hydrolase [Mesorhizobium sp.]TJV92592.1 MAG: HAD family hydrolase [Mesorhizobium sp.]